MWYSSATILLTASILNFPLLTSAEADGLIVPFTSELPACAAKCGPLYDAQGACTPPNIAATSDSCFCAYPALQSFLTTTQGVCPEACPADATGLSSIQQWFLKFCNVASATTTSAAGSTSTSESGSGSGSGSSSQSTHHGWFANHWKWVLMLIILVLAMVFGWVGAFYLRRHILRKREKAFEMRPPVAWGPHQLQGMTGGYTYGDGTVDVAKAGAAPVGRGTVMNEKNAAAAADAQRVASNGEKGGKKERNWLRKSRA